MGLRLLIAIGAVALLAGCSKPKDVNNYFPKLGNVSCKSLPDGTVEFTVEVTQTGSGDIQFLGICVDTFADVHMATGVQKSTTTLTGNTYKVVYDDLDANKTYYYRAIVANDNGYALSATGNVPKPVVSSFSCTPTNNLYSFQGISTPPDHFMELYKYEQSMFEYTMHASAGLADFYFVFGRKPTTGVYTITNYNKIDDNKFKGRQVGITYYPDATGYIFSDGTLSVNQKGGDTIEVTICDGKCYFSQTTFGVMTAKFTSPGY